MLEIKYTHYFEKLKKRNADAENVVAKFCQVKSKAEFMLLCDLCGFQGALPTDVFMMILSCKLIEAQSSVAIDEATATELKGFLDVVYAVARETTLIDGALKSKAFVNTCGRWMVRGYSRKDKGMFLKMAKILAIAAEKSGL